MATIVDKLPYNQQVSPDLIERVREKSVKERETN
jgi:hypothetical protein